MNKIRYSFIAAVTTVAFVMSCSDDDAPPPNLDLPEISTDVTAVDFGSLDINEESEVMAVVVSGEFLESDVTVAIPAGFEASLSETADFTSDDIAIPQASFDNNATVSVYVRMPGTDAEGNVAGTLVLSATDADNAEVALTANVGLQITGQLFMSDFLEQYGAEWQTTLPLDSGILNWQLQTDTVVNLANAGGGYPEETIPNNEVYNTWYTCVPLNGSTIRGSQSISESSSLTITGYPAVAGARSILIKSGDESELFKWVNKNNGNCGGAKTATGNNTSVGRRFAEDGYRGNTETGDVFMSALINVSALGGQLEGKPDVFGSGDIIALANATSGPSNNNTVKVLALTDDAGGLKFGLLKENEGNPSVLSEGSYDLNTTYAVVLRHQFVEGDANDITTLYVFAEGDEIPVDITDAEAVATIDASYNDGQGVDPLDLNITYIRERNQSVIAPEAEITGIRVGDTWRATLFADHASAINSNDLTLNNRVLSNKGSDCE